jgi:hypothetical protein
MRIRLTLRRTMLLVVLVALGLLAWVEFREGSPPRFVLKGVPARVARLRPGMSFRETKEILGLETSWLRGGTGACTYYGSGGRTSMMWVYALRQEQITAAVAALMKARSPGLVPHIEPSAKIELSFIMDLKEDERDWRQSPSTRLASARFIADGRVVADMPR